MSILIGPFSLLKQAFELVKSSQTATNKIVAFALASASVSLRQEECGMIRTIATPNWPLRNGGREEHRFLQREIPF
jgi:hypothetical protein